MCETLEPISGPSINIFGAAIFTPDERERLRGELISAAQKVPNLCVKKTIGQNTGMVRAEDVANRNLPENLRPVHQRKSSKEMRK